MCLLDVEPSLRQPFGVQTPTVLIILDEEHNRARFGRSHWRVPGPSICAAGSGDQKFADSGLQQREAYPRPDEVRIAELAAVLFGNLHIRAAIDVPISAMRRSRFDRPWGR